jgi:hypothetical protein
MNDEAHNEPPKGDPPVRVCPSCSAQSQTFSDTCPHCGASFIRSRSKRVKRKVGGWSRRRKITALVILAALVGVAVGVGVILKVNHDNQVAEQHKEEQEALEVAQAERAAARAKLRAEELEEEKLVQEELQAQEELERIEVKYGHESVAELEGAITKEADEESSEGFSEYVTRTNCEPTSGRLEPSKAAQDFRCIAVTSEDSDGTESGYRYEGTITTRREAIPGDSAAESGL